MSTSLYSKFLGCLIGSAIGDVLGARGSRYTDDTAMMIGVAESLIENRGFNAKHMFFKFLENYEKEPWRGYAFGPPRIFELVRSGIDWREAPYLVYPGGSFGNGAAMRVAPIGLLYYDDANILRDIACRASALTHTHPLGCEGAYLQAYACALAVKETRYPIDSSSFLSNLQAAVRENVYKRKLDAIYELLNKKQNIHEVIEKLGNTVEAFNSVPTAIYAFLVNDSFKEALLYCLRLGGDTDTIGAMTGAISGAYYGVEQISKEWIKNLENREYIRALAHELWKLKSEGYDLD